VPKFTVALSSIAGMDELGPAKVVRVREPALGLDAVLGGIPLDEIGATGWESAMQQRGRLRTAESISEEGASSWENDWALYDSSRAALAAGLARLATRARRAGASVGCRLPDCSVGAAAKGAA
jgi:hypothetical protein